MRIVGQLGAVEQPLPHGRGSDLSHDRKGVVSTQEHLAEFEET
jgi:hypothetical protein